MKYRQNKIRKINLGNVELTNRGPTKNPKINKSRWGGLSPGTGE